VLQSTYWQPPPILTFSWVTMSALGGFLRTTSGKPKTSHHLIKDK
jgi:hypothetical protein